MEFFTISLLNGISYGLLLFMLSSGLTLIFSMMGVLNFAHASFYMLGAYFGYTVTDWLGFWPALLLAPLGVALGLTDSTAAAVWGAVSLIVAFFVGGWVVGRTMSYEDGLLAGAHGLLSWAVALCFLLLIAAIVGAGAAGAATPGGGVPSITVPTTVITGASLGGFIAMLLGAVSAVAGAIVGNTARTAPRRVL